MTVKRVYQEAASCCAFCNQADVAALEIHHLDDNPANNTLDNLLLVCSTCHSKITHGTISTADAHLQKRIIEHQAKANTSHKAAAKQSVTVAHTNNSGIIANVVNIKARKTPKINYPLDAIGSDTVKKNYVDYLYGRYIEYRKADVSFGAQKHALRFHPGELHRTIRARFNAQTFFIHVNRFNELIEYMQQRVDNTILGRRNTSRGTPNYESYETFRLTQLGQ